MIVYSVIVEVVCLFGLVCGFCGGFWVCVAIVFSLYLFAYLCFVIVLLFPVLLLNCFPKDCPNVVIIC